MVLSGTVVASPAIAVSPYPCGAESSGAVGTLESLALPGTIVAGDELRMQVSIGCQGDQQAVLAHMHLTFENDQGITTKVSVDKAGIEAGAANGASTTYTVTILTPEGSLPEGLQRLTYVTPVMEMVPRFPTGAQPPLYSRTIYQPYLSLHRTAGWEVLVGHPTHAAPTPQVPWAFKAGVPAEVRFPAWGKGAVLTYRWLLEDGTPVADRREYIPAAGSVSRIVVTGTWPDGTVHERSSMLARTVEDAGGFNDVTVGQAMPYSDHAVRVVRTAPEQSTRSGWYRLRSDGSFTSTREAAPDSWYPAPTDVGQRFQFIEAGARVRGASAVITVGPAPLPEDRRSGYVHGDTLVNTAAELQPRLQPGYRLTANNPWPAGQAVTYAWLRNGKTVPGAITAAYTLAASDAGATIQAVVRTGSPGYVSNEAKASVVKIPLVNLKSAEPLVSGSARVGVTLRASTPGWTAGTKFSYQWLRNGQTIQGATRSSYAVPAKDRHAVLQVRVTGAQTFYTTVTRKGAEHLINYGILTAPAPGITGTPQAGRTLTAHAGSWTPGTQLRYQWYRNNQPIRGATMATYRIAAADRGQAIKVQVRGTKEGYTGIWTTSAQKRVQR
ncbi:hypothetical protein SAMN04487916_1119 [Arthrobacter sp. ov407]|nr:hypothetical protein SAMN04487916_1119 [Arthrobacter sp. ov407]